MKLKSKDLTPGDVVKVNCKTHGKQAYIAGVHVPLDIQEPVACPYCLRPMIAGKRYLVGEGYIDTRGVAYIVDEHGSLRKLQGISEKRAKVIQGRRKMFRGETLEKEVKND